jgi:hypothetical protein
MVSPPKRLIAPASGRRDQRREVRIVRPQHRADVVEGLATLRYRIRGIHHAEALVGTLDQERFTRPRLELLQDAPVRIEEIAPHLDHGHIGEVGAQQALMRVLVLGVEHGEVGFLTDG